MSLRSSLGLTQDATASQKKMKSCVKEEMGKAIGAGVTVSPPGADRGGQTGPHLDDTPGVHANHHTDPPEGGVFLLVVPDVP